MIKVIVVCDVCRQEGHTAALASDRCIEALQHSLEVTKAELEDIKDRAVIQGRKWGRA